MASIRPCAGHVDATFMCFDDLGRLLGLGDPLAGELLYAYDAIHTVHEVTEPGGVATSFARKVLDVP